MTTIAFVLMTTQLEMWAKFFSFGFGNQEPSFHDNSLHVYVYMTVYGCPKVSPMYSSSSPCTKAPQAPALIRLMSPGSNSIWDGNQAVGCQFKLSTLSHTHTHLPPPPTLGAEEPHCLPESQSIDPPPPPWCNSL